MRYAEMLRTSMKRAELAGAWQFFFDPSSALHVCRQLATLKRYLKQNNVSKAGKEVAVVMLGGGDAQLEVGTLGSWA